jgi:type I restriction enzyme M protein
MVQAIFTDAITHLREPKDLKTLTTNIDKIDWFTAREDGLGDMYEGLMQKVMSDTKSKAGAVFHPPRPDRQHHPLDPAAGGRD